MHHGTRAKNSAGLNDERVQLFTTDRQGLLEWCNYLHDHFDSFGKGSDWLSDRAVTLIESGKIPCHNEVLHWVRWHDLAIKTIRYYYLDSMVLYYEDYSLSYNQTVDSVFNFLGLSPIYPPAPFVPGKTYRHLFTNQEARSMAQLVKEVASRPCWNLLRRYFEPWIGTSMNETTITV